MILSSHDARLDRQLVDRAGLRVPGDLLVGVTQLEQHSSGLHVGDPPLRRTLTGTHPGFGRLLGQRTVGEDVDPHLAATLDVPVDGDTSGLDLPVGDVGMLQRLDAIVTEAHRRPTAGDAALPGMVLLAVLYLAGNQHDSALRALRRRFRRSPGSGLGAPGCLGDCRCLLGARSGAAGGGARRGGTRCATTARTGARRTLAARTIRAGRHRRGRFALATDDVALVNPHLHADAAEGRLGLVQPVIDVGAQRVQRHPTLAVELRTAHLGAAEAARALHADALDVGLAHRRLDGLAHRAAERHTVRKLFRHTLSDELRLRLGVLDLEDVQLDLLLGQLFQVGADAVGLGATTPDDDARSRGVDINSDSVASPFDLHVGDAGALETGGQKPTDRHVFLDVVLVLLVGVPPGLPVGGDTEAEAVGIDLLAHYSEPSFASSEASVFLAAAFLAAAFSGAFFAADFLAGAFSAVVASAVALVAGDFLAAAALLPCARRGRAALADRPPPRSSFDGRLSTITVMWLVRLRIRNARPWARGRMRLAVGPSPA